MKRTTLLRFAVVLGLSFGGEVASASVFRVDANSTAGTPDGASWITAYASLQEAIDPSINTSLAAGDEIWIAQGTYHPDDGTLDRTATFQLVHRVSMRGGFKGLSDLPNGDTQILDASLTILSGDLEGDDEDVNGDTTDNSLVVVTAGLDAQNIVDNLTRLEYLTIERGDHTQYGGSGSDGDGAGIVISEGSNPQILNCIIRNNNVPEDNRGAGVLILTQDTLLNVRVEGCSIENNNARVGAGICVVGSFVDAVDTTIKENHLNAQTTSPVFPVEGAGFYLDSESIGTFTQCTIRENTWVADDDLQMESPAYGAGGSSHGQLTMRHCEIIANTLTGLNAQPNGGGVYLGAPAELIDCTFDSNIAWGKFFAYGAGLALDQAASGTEIVNCQFELNLGGTVAPNATTGYGGGIYIGGSADMVNSLIAENFVNGKGGGIYDAAGTSRFVNCTIAENEARIDQGGGWFIATTAT